MLDLSPGCGTEYNVSWTKGMGITTPGSLLGLCSSSARKAPDAALRWKRRGVKLYFPGSERRWTGCKMWRDERIIPDADECFATVQHAVVGLPVHSS